MRHPELRLPGLALATAVLLAVSGAAVPATASAAVRGATPTVAAPAPAMPSAVPPTPTKAVAEPTGAADCSDASLAAKAADAKPATAAAPAELRGRKVFTCVSIDAAATGAAAKARTQALRADRAARGTAASAAAKLRSAREQAPSAQENLPLPDFCYDHAFDGLWWGNRTENCMISDITVLIYVEEDGVRELIGTAQALEYAFAFTSDTIDNFAYQIRVQKYFGTGYGTFDLFSRVYGFSWCDGACKQDSDTGLRPGNFRNNVNNDGMAFYDSTEGQPGGIGYSTPWWGWRVQYPGTDPSTPRDLGTPGIRCDNAYTDDGNNWNDPAPAANAVIGAGCVFYGYVPVMVYSKSGAFGNLATHVEAAQNSGLPGAYPNGAVLRRLVDPVAKRANGDLACPAVVWVRPTDKSCDEYPPRSTKQGAAQPPQGTARTFAPPNTSWCEMDPAWGVPTGVIGPTGWSSCMLPERENSVGGSLLGGFYRSNRVLDNDPFFIWIQP
jgi:hypothetical protein